MTGDLAMLETVLFATLRFHDTTSRGRLLNRFGKDVEGLDSSMADNCKLQCTRASVLTNIQSLEASSTGSTS